MKISILIWLSILVVSSQSEVLSYTVQPSYPYLQNFQNGPSYPYNNNAQIIHLIYIDKNNDFAISNTGKLFLLETDYSERIKKITGQSGKIIYMQSKYFYNSVFNPFHNYYIK